MTTSPADRARTRTGRPAPATVVGLALLIALGAACSTESAAAPPQSTTSSSSTTTTTVARTTTSAPVVNAGLAPPKVPRTGAYFGAWRGPGPGRPNSNPKLNLQQAEQAIGRKYAIDHQYYQWGDPIPTAYQTWTVSQHRIPMLSLCACHFSGSVVSWARIAAGKEDAYLVSVARGFVALHSPAFFVFDAEPETNVGARGPASDYVAAFRHVVAVFRAQKATNVAFVWATTAFAWQPGSGETSIVKTTYPGDAYVNWIALDPYNFDANGAWHTLSFEVDPWYSWARSAHATKPLMLTEWGSKEDPNVPTRKAIWFRDALTALSQKYRAVHAVVYFDERKVEHGTINDWRIDTSTPSLSAFAQIAKASWFDVAS
ncbi:MAG TPA: hypothetical protein VH914_12965 [Acidimicrobiia bacterium]|nr:hypothetical protein [Acidimicrobiia bacterium]